VQPAEEPFAPVEGGRCLADRLPGLRLEGVELGQVRLAPGAVPDPGRQQGRLDPVRRLCRSGGQLPACVSLLQFLKATAVQFRRYSVVQLVEPAPG
jgi:hypothetical protein